MTEFANWEDRDEDFESQEVSEEADDLHLTEADFRNLLVAPADWTIATLYAQIGKQIDLDPDFQRRNVWNSQSKSRFIESIFLGIPIPQILLSAKPAQKSSFLVLDGKQRLITIKEFIDGAFANGRKFKLRGLRVLTDLEGLSWGDIKNDDEIASKLLNETQRTSVLRGWSSDPVLYEIFFRINSGSVKLSPMELRMSLFPGPFLKYIMRWTEVIGPVHHLLKKRVPDSRMVDVELAVRYLAFKDQEIVYSGDLKRYLDETCQKYNALFTDEEKEKEVEFQLDQLNRAIDAGIEIFSINKFCRKFDGAEYERPFNRAIFDVLVGALSNANLRNWALANKGAFKRAYEDVSKNNDFRRAVEATTKSVEATRTRFSLGYRKFASVSNVPLDIPAISE